MILRNIIVFLALAIPFFGLSYWLTSPPSSPVHENLPWEVEVLPGGGSRVFGVTLGETPLGNLSDRLRARPRLEWVVAPDGERRLEATFEGVTLGPFLVDLVARLDAPEPSPGSVPGSAAGDGDSSAGGRRLPLPEGGGDRAMALPVVALIYAPRARYSEDTVEQRFGDPAARFAAQDGRYFLYPGQGLALYLAREGRDVLHYVPPRDFGALEERLRDGDAPEGVLP
ncbi:hypothetical protein [Ectothiorhodospira mobilis]|uniref:hypothetical protein n=1 Tax=Ectothiorhodospira mobilis TaxID=195064 RepID=UPI001908A31D|nr:hypothetical protein [Ectothiorhodospira mobilis]MBK1692647.1 hypothetical protein [Ectothiorhodospira mobilis]